MKYVRNMLIVLIAFLLYAWACVSSCTAQVALDPVNMNYDIEVNPRETLGDTVYQFVEGDSIRVIWNQSLTEATAEDSAKVWDRSPDWKVWIRGLSFAIGGELQWKGIVDLPPGTYSLRVKSWYFNKNIPSPENKWISSPAPSDEVGLEITASPEPPPSDTQYPAPSNPSDIRIN